MFGHELDSLYLAFERGGSGAYGYPPAASDFRKHDRVDRDRATAAPLALSRKRARDLQKEPVALFLRVSGRGILEAVRDSSTSFALLTSLRMSVSADPTSAEVRALAITAESPGRST